MPFRKLQLYITGVQKENNTEKPSKYQAGERVSVVHKDNNDTPENEETESSRFNNIDRDEIKTSCTRSHACNVTQRA